MDFLNLWKHCCRFTHTSISPYKNYMACRWQQSVSRCIRPTCQRCLSSTQCCGVGAGVGVVRSRSFLGGVGFLTTWESDFFVRLWLRMSNWVIFYITHLIWEFLFKWYNFFWNFVETEVSCCAPRFPLILTAKFHSLYVKESEPGVGVGNKKRSRSQKFWNVGVRYFTSDSTTLVEQSHAENTYFMIKKHFIHKKITRLQIRDRFVRLQENWCCS